jgi:predicted nuclease of predicted toxin-antitoxin system
MNFLANENFPLFSIRLLRDAGYTVASVIEDSPGARDYDVLKRASEGNYIILTFDRDYGELIYRRRSLLPGGVAYFRFDPSTPEEPAEILLNILGKEKITLSGKFTVIERGRIRQRTLAGISHKEST